jgi:hypothetical protein
MQCRLVKNRRFGITYPFHVQGSSVQEECHGAKGLNQPTLRNIREDDIIQVNRCEILRSRERTLKSANIYNLFQAKVCREDEIFCDQNSLPVSLKSLQKHVFLLLCQVSFENIYINFVQNYTVLFEG